MAPTGHQHESAAPMHRASEPTSGRRIITLAGQALASASAQRSRVNVVRATSAHGLPAIDVLAGIAARDPSGLVFIGNGTSGLAFALDRGHITSACGTEPRGSMSSWSSSASPDDMRVWVKDGPNAGRELRRAFIQRCVLDRLCLATQTGSVLTVVRGDVRWLGASLERDCSPSLQHVLIEHARENDEVGRLQTRMGSAMWIARPDTPPDAPTSSRPALRAVPNDEASFGDLAGHEDASSSSLALLTAVWRMCDGRTTVGDLTRRSLFGRSPTMRALWELKGRGNVEFVAPGAVSPQTHQSM